MALQISSLGHHPSKLKINDGKLSIGFIVDDNLWVSEEPRLLILGHAQIIEIDKELVDFAAPFIFIHAELVLQAWFKKAGWQELDIKQLGTEQSGAGPQRVLRMRYSRTPPVRPQRSVSWAYSDREP